MSDLTITLPDGTEQTHPAGVTPGEIAHGIGRRLGRDALAATVDGEWVDLDTPIGSDASVAIITPASDEGREVLRHSTAHVLAQAVTDLFPGALFAIGPAIDDGFYYDFELPGGAHFSDNDLERIENRMREIVAVDEEFVREEVDRDEALAVFADQPLKREIIERVDDSEVGEGSVISLYRNPQRRGWPHWQGQR